MASSASASRPPTFSSQSTKCLAPRAYRGALAFKPSRLKLCSNSTMRSSRNPGWLVSLDIWLSCCCPSREPSGERSYGEYPTDRGRGVCTTRRPTLHNGLLNISNALAKTAGSKRPMLGTETVRGGLLLDCPSLGQLDLTLARPRQGAIERVGWVRKRPTPSATIARNKGEAAPDGRAPRSPWCDADGV